MMIPSEESPLLRRPAARASPRDIENVRIRQQAAALSAVFVIGYLFMLLVLSSSSVPHVHFISPTGQPTGFPSGVPTPAPSDFPTMHPSHRPSFRPTVALTRKPTAAPSSHKPTRKPTVHKTKHPTKQPVVHVSRLPCKNNETFQESAHNLVYQSFDELNFAVRSTIEVLKNRLGTYSFAYFPLSNTSGTVSYLTWTVPNMDMDQSPPQPVPLELTTEDPIEVLIYYTNSIYTTIGDLEDSETGHDKTKILRMQQLLGNLTTSWTAVISNGVIPGLSWRDYLKYPGPNGRVWPDGTIVSWTKTTTYEDLSSALFVDKSNRTIDEQLWGKHRPHQGSSVMRAISDLIASQVEESVVRYDDLKALDPSGQGNWATLDIMSTNEGIFTYHKVRKVLRMIGVTIDAFPDIISAFFDRIPAHIVEYVNTYYEAELPTELNMTYGDIFCYNTTSLGLQVTFSTDGYYCDGPVASIGTMIFSNISDFNSSFFGIGQRSLDTLRVVLMIKAFKLGEQEVFSSTYGCPSTHDSYSLIMKSNSTDPFDPAVDGWIPPSLAGHNITGTVCDIDDYFGDIHDLLVRIQQNDTIVNSNYIAYAIQTAQGLQQFLNVLDLPHVLNDNLLNGLCRG